MTTEHNEIQNHLKHILPESTQDAANRLADILKIPLFAVKRATSNTLESLAGTILYRHLERPQQAQVLRLIDNEAPILQGKLRPLIAGIIVNPYWGLWSLTRKELEEKFAFNSEIDSIFSTLGVGISVSSATSAFKDYFQYREDLKNSSSKQNSEKLKQAVRAKGIKKGFITLVIWGAVEFNNNEMKKLKEELNNRKPIIQSKYY